MVVVALAVALDRWMASGVGRAVVEGQLSRALARPVRLEGAFDPQLLPMPGVAGTRLAIHADPQAPPVMDAERFLARLALWPLLRGEVEVVAIRLEAGRISIPGLMKSPGEVRGDEPRARAPNVPYFRLPAIRRLELSEMSLHFDDLPSDPQLVLRELVLMDFRVDAPAPIEAHLAVPPDGALAAAVWLDGTLALTAEGRIVLALSRADLEVAEGSIRRMRGELSADLEESLLTAGFGWEGRPGEVRLSVSVAWDAGYAGQISGMAVENLNIALDEQIAEGGGCILTGEEIAVHLKLNAGRLDLDALQALVEEWFPGGSAQVPAVEDGSGGNESVAAPELPFGLSLLLEVEQAAFGEAVARGVRLQVGAPPACPERL